MAITQTFTVGFALTVGFKTEDYEMIGDVRAELHKAVAKAGLEVILATRAKREHHEIKAMLDPTVTNEEIFVMSVKSAVRDHLEEFAEDDKNGTFIRVGDISTKIRGPVEAITECPRCALNKTCQKIAVAGCKAVTTVPVLVLKDVPKSDEERLASGWDAGDV